MTLQGWTGSLSEKSSSCTMVGFAGFLLRLHVCNGVPAPQGASSVYRVTVCTEVHWAAMCTLDLPPRATWVCRPPSSFTEVRRVSGGLTPDAFTAQRPPGLLHRGASEAGRVPFLRATGACRLGHHLVTLCDQPLGHHLEPDRHTSFTEVHRIGVPRHYHR